MKSLTRIAVFAFAAIVLTSCNGVPDAGSEEHTAAVRSFYVGLAALEVGDDPRAIEELGKSITAAPSEPATHNNLGVLYLRQRDLGKAEENFTKASGLVSDSAPIEANLASLELAKGNPEQALVHLRRTVELDPDDDLSRFAIAEQLEKEGKDAEALKELSEEIGRRLKNNPALQLEIARLAAKTGSKEELAGAVKELSSISAGWSEEIKEQFAKLKDLSESGDAEKAALQTSFLKNVLLRDSGFRAALAEIKQPDTAPGRLIRRPLVLAAPEFRPAPADTGITFEKKVVADVEAKTAFAVFKDGSEPVVAYSTDEKTVIGDQEIPVGVESPRQVAQIDFDYDFRIDLAFATEKGFRLFRQQEDGTYEDVTSETGLASEITDDSFNGAWVFDYDSEGDLDIVLAPSDGSPLVLRNEADGKFSKVEPFSGVSAAVDFVSGDFDEDGDADAAALLSDGKPVVNLNNRGGTFSTIPFVNPNNGLDLQFVGIQTYSFVGMEQGVGGPPPQSSIGLMLLMGDGANVYSVDESGFHLANQWSLLSIPGESFDEIGSRGILDSSGRVLLTDIDNNGLVDSIVSRQDNTWVLWLQNMTPDAKRPDHAVRLQESSNQQEFAPIDFADLDADGSIELVGLDKGGKPAVLKPKLTRNYHWQIIRPKAQKTEGDQRINSYGIGGTMEIRTGLHAQSRQITSPQVHFGLGENTSADVLRVVWQNGYVQAEFDLKSDQVIEAEQRLKGSCPHLFAWNGEKFEHVKDAPPWSPALGLKINAQDTYGILQTEEWFKIPGDALKPKDGAYELRITGEYWESFYLDSYRLLVVDHPEDTEIFTDERFSIPLPPLEVFTTGELNGFESATDHNGRDVLVTVSKLDEEYLDGIERGRYQGVAEDHWVELELPEIAPPDGRLWIVGEGWMHPTDASINVQRGQAEPAPPKSLSIEIPDGNGGWNAVKENLGFPAGKMKNVLLDISGIFPAGAKDRRIRLRTELEVFWDRLSWAVGKDGAATKINNVDLGTAELRYRGFSIIEKRDDSSPEVPDYQRILTTAQRWRDLEGYYTRFGDVKELLAGTDDRYVLANAGDELVLTFPALPPSAVGYTRDFVIVGNGWIKDGDLNSVFSRTLLPLPTQATNDYTRAPTILEDDPVYRKNKADWVKFHTRYVAPDGFRSSVRQK